MEGILLIDKPSGITSNNLVQKVKRHLKTTTGSEIKVGHTGTLDFFASGLMVLTLGKATRLTEYFQGLDKEYIATGELGKITDTYDIQGKIIYEKECTITEEELKKIILSFEKTYPQTPPPFSSKRINGVRAYQLVKKGITPQLKPKTVTIYSIQILEVHIPEFTIKVHCSSGTYIRSLIKEIGDETGCGAYTKSLRRTRVGKFRVEDAVPLEKFLEMGLPEIEKLIIPVQEGLYFFPEITLDEGFDRRFAHGQRFRVPFDIHGYVRVFSQDGRFLGVGFVKEEKILQPVKVFL